MRLYNIFFPIWMLIFFPPIVLLILPANFVFDLAVLLLTMKFLQIHEGWKYAKTVILRVWLCGFAADLLGAMLMMLPVVPFNLGEPLEAVFYNPFAYIGSFLWATSCICVSAAVIYGLNYYFCLNRLPFNCRQRRRLSLSLAVFTAPYLYYMPTNLFYDILSLFAA